ncbi:MAG: RHS repeat-associated core domain-containing protein [Bacteroidales bacterium]
MGDLNYNYSTEENKYLYQGKELQDVHNLNWMDFGARMYDPQIGRWHCADPAVQYSSPYLAMGNDPMNRIDPNGMWDIWRSVRNFFNNWSWQQNYLPNYSDVYGSGWNWQEGMAYCGFSNGEISAFLSENFDVSGGYGHNGGGANGSGGPQGGAAGAAIGGGSGNSSGGGSSNGDYVTTTSGQVGGYEVVLDDGEVIFVNIPQVTVETTAYDNADGSDAANSGGLTTNNSNNTIYYKPDNIADGDWDALPLNPGASTNTSVDAVNVNGQVYKVRDGYNSLSINQSNKVVFDYPWYTPAWPRVESKDINWMNEQLYNSDGSYKYYEWPPGSGNSVRDTQWWNIFNPNNQIPDPRK